MRIVDNVSQLVGHTPLLSAARFSLAIGLRQPILAKLEYLNPAGSVKDRVACEMLDDAQTRGVLTPGAAIIEPTSGNTGIGLCMIAAARGYKAIIVMPDNMSVERQKLMKAYGAQLVLTPGAEGMTGAIKKAKELAAGLPGSFLPAQFENPANPAAHYKTTGPEIWQDTDGTVDAFVAGIGTGGTITGVGRYLKEKNPAIHIVGVEPLSSPVLTAGHAGKHGLQGIGAGFVPKILDTAIYNRIIPATEEDAYTCARIFAEKEGILVGISSGAALWAAVQLAKDSEYRHIVALLPDTGDRYLSTPLFG